MTDKGIGFNRHVFLPWLDQAAALCTAMDDPAEIRLRLEAILAANTRGVGTRRKAIDILLNVWLKTKTSVPSLWQAASRSYPEIPASSRIWLHYGLVMVAYPFVRDCLQMIGQFSRSGSSFTKIMLRDRLMAQRGPLGSLERSLRYVLASLRQWNVIQETSQRYTYQANSQGFSAGLHSLEAWLLACALQAHPSEELPYADLIRLPELFPFRLTLTIDRLRADPRFTIHRQGLEWDMVGLSDERLQD